MLHKRGTWDAKDPLSSNASSHNNHQHFMEPYSSVVSTLLATSVLVILLHNCDAIYPFHPMQYTSDLNSCHIWQHMGITENMQYMQYTSDLNSCHSWGEQTITRIFLRIIKLFTFDKFAFKDAISTFHGEDGIDDFAGGWEVKMDGSRSMKCSAIVQIGNAQQVCYLANWELMCP